MVNSRHSRDNFSLLNLKFFVNTTVNCVNEQVNNYSILETFKSRKVSGNWDRDWIDEMNIFVLVRDGMYNKEWYHTNRFIFCFFLQLEWLIEANDIKCNKFFWDVFEIQRIPSSYFLNYFDEWHRIWYFLKSNNIKKIIR